MLLGVTLCASIAPDLDFLPGILIGDMRAFHHGISHSLTFAILFGVTTFLIARWQASDNAMRISVLAMAAYAAHVILDLVSVNQGARGVPVLWPLSQEEIGLNLRVFGHFRYGDISEGVWIVLRWDNVVPLVRELAILGTLVIILGCREQIRHTLVGLRTKVGRRCP